MTSRETVWVGHVLQMLGMRDKFKSVCRKLEFSVSEDLNADGKIILKWIIHE
jgi:hypothetical protein